MPTKKRTRKLSWGAGTIYSRGGTYYFENKVKGVTRKSLRTSDRDEAVAEAKRRFGYLEHEASADQQEKLLQQYETTRDRIQESRRRRMPLSDLMTKYKGVLTTRSKKGRRHVEAEAKTPIAPATLRTTTSVVGRFVAWLATDHPDATTVDAVTPQIAEAYFLELRETAKSSSYNRHLAALRVVWDTVAIAAGIDANPFKQIPQLSKADVENETAERRAFSPTELVTMQDRAAGWIRPAMFIAFYTGLRLSDIVCLKWADIDADGFFDVQARKTSKRDLIYAPEAREHLQAWHQQQNGESSEYVFPRLAAAYLGIGRKQDRARASKEFMHFLKEVCKFDTDDGDGRLTFHSLRVTHATYAHRSGVTREQIQKQLQHSQATTTDVYIDETADEVRQKLVAAHRPLSFNGDAAGPEADTMARVRELAESMTAKNWRKVRDELLALA